MDYGVDMLLADDDVCFTEEGELQTVSGPACIAQDIDQELKLSVGTLAWDKSAGSSMLTMLNDSESDPASVIIELERVAIRDPRVDPESVTVTQLSGESKYRLEFRPLSAIKPEVLDFDLAGKE